MTPKERFRAALNLETPDRIPTMYVQLGGGNCLQERTGITIKEGYANEQKFANLCLAAKDFGFDNVMAGWGDLLMEAQAFGVALAFPNERDYPRDTAIAEEQIESLATIDPMKNEIWSTSLKAAKMMNEKVGDEVAVIGHCSDPFVTAAAIRGFDRILMDELMEANRTHHLLKAVTESLQEYGRLLREYAGLEFVFIQDGIADAEQNMFELSKTFDIDYAKKMVDSFHSDGLTTILSNPSLKPYFEAQFDTVRPKAMHLNIDWKDYTKAVSKLQGNACLAAGIDPHFIGQSTPEGIEEKVKQVIQMSGGGNGLIITSAGEIPLNASSENIEALAKSTRGISIE